MRLAQYLLCCLIMSWGLSATAVADSGDISGVIDHFVTKHFPDAQSHFWVVNDTEWGAEDEVVVDLNTIVSWRDERGPTEERFLLLIVKGHLVATQSVPLDAKVECKPEEVV